MRIASYNARRLRPLVVSTLCSASMGLSACKDLSSPLPAGAIDPNTYNTPAAALQLVHGARYAYQASLTWTVGALMTDELQSQAYGAPVGTAPSSGTGFEIPTDSRQFETTAQGHTSLALYTARRQARLARAAVEKYAPTQPSSVRAEMLMYEAMADIDLADYYCSGIPLSIVSLDNDYSYRPGSTTDEVYRAAIVLLDSAVALSTDSVNIQYAVRVAKGRALVALGEYATADTVVAPVPAGFRFTLPFAFFNLATFVTSFTVEAGVGDHKGVNGLPFVSAFDPRVRAEDEGQNDFGIEVYYLTPNVVTTTLLASAVEARLIQAEAALQRGDPSWLTMLNTLRTSGPLSVTGTDTVWQAGTGGVDSLAPLRDPALDPLPPGKTAFDVRLDLIFYERGFWLYLTGRRQGDLRRLVRKYHRTIESTYPWGPYLGGTGSYGAWIDLPIDEVNNPLFTGCFSREKDQ